MSEYTAPLKDMSFVLKHVVGIERIGKLPGCEEVTADLVDAIFEEAGKFSANVLSPINRSGDVEGKVAYARRRPRYKMQPNRTKFRAVQIGVAERRRRSYCCHVLRLQARFAAPSANIEEIDGLSRQSGKSDRGTNDLPPTFSIGTVYLQDR